MSLPKRYPVSITTASDGTATGFSDTVTGRILTIIYVKDGTTPFSNGVGFTVTAEATGENIWTEAAVNASAVRAPRQPTHSQAGVAALYAAAGTAVNDYIALVNDRVKIAIASGGATKLGQFYVVVG